MEEKEIQNSTKSTLSKKEALLIALEKNLGNVTLATKAVGLDRTTYYYYCDTDEDFKKKAEAVGEIALDFAESSLFKNIQQGDTTATIFYLKTKGKKRGYVERVETESVIKMPDFSILRK